MTRKGYFPFRTSGQVLLLDRSVFRSNRVGVLSCASLRVINGSAKRQGQIEASRLISPDDQSLPLELLLHLLG